MSMSSVGSRTWRSEVCVALRGIPTIAWICVLVAVLNGVAWSIVTPPFQGRDEPDQFSYVQKLVETHSLPKRSPNAPFWSPEETRVMSALDQLQIRFKPQVPAISTMAQQRVLTREIDAGASPVDPGGAGVATSEPPLYYGLESIPYLLAKGNILSQLELMRLLSVLISGLTVLLIYLFLKEALPSVPWVASVCTLCVAIQPLFGYMSGSLTPDNLLYAVSAALFLCLARGFRHGLTGRLAISMGVLIAVGFATKLNFVGLSFGVFAGLLVLSVREARRTGARAYVWLALATGIAVFPVALYALVNLFSNHPTLGFTSESIKSFLNGNIVHEIDYVWELYLPRLPGMTHYFLGVSTFRDIWFDHSVGLYGWGDTQFPRWVDNLALVAAIAIAILCVAELVRGRRALLDRWLELAVYAMMSLGVLVMVGLESYSADILSQQEAYGDPRYLLPMLALFGGVLTLAVRGAGRRFAPAVAGVLVVLFVAHDVFSQLQEIARYYG
jgi:hypothetical protein